MTKKELNKLISETVKSVIKEETLAKKKVVKEATPASKFDENNLKLVKKVLELLVSKREDFVDTSNEKARALRTSLEDVKKSLKNLNGDPLTKTQKIFDDVEDKFESAVNAIEALDNVHIEEFWTNRPTRGY